LIKDIHILQQSEQQLRDEAAQRRQEVESLRQENVVLEQEVGALRNSRVL
jgi:hypothetical protein